MVGVPRSHGCLLCVRRRIRCDEGRPACSKCQVYGAACPGYDRSLKFVSGKHQVRKRGVETAERSGTRQIPDSTPPAAEPVANAVSLAICPPPRACRAAYINTIFDMANTDGPERNRLFHGSWIHQIPTRLGLKATLDSAVCSLAMHLLGKSRQDDGLVIQSRGLYGQSLAALQAALNHPVEWRSSETLCTAMVLCLFELFADTSGTSTGWIQHSSAVAHLMQKRGADGFRDTWDQAMLFSFRALIIVNAISTGKDCFLAKKQWQRILINDLTVVNPAPTMPASLVRVVDRCTAHMARLPGVMRHGWAIRKARQHGLPVDAAQVAMLRRSAYNLRAVFAAWFKESKLFLGDPIITSVPSSVPHDAPPSPYSVVFAYRDPWAASVYLRYATGMLIIQESINQCSLAHAEAAEAAKAAAAAAGSSSCTVDRSTVQQSEPPFSTASSTTSTSTNTAHDDSTEAYPFPTPPSPEALPETPGALVPFDVSNRALCYIIYRSFEKLGDGVMGPFRLGFCMRISYEFADVHTQLWILALLRRASKVYATARTDSYPPPGQNEYNYN